MILRPGLRGSPFLRIGGFHLCSIDSSQHPHPGLEEGGKLLSSQMHGRVSQEWMLTEWTHPVHHLGLCHYWRHGELEVPWSTLLLVCSHLWRPPGSASTRSCFCSLSLRPHVGPNTEVRVLQGRVALLSWPFTSKYAISVLRSWNLAAKILGRVAWSRGVFLFCFVLPFDSCRMRKHWRVGKQERERETQKGRFG